MPLCTALPANPMQRLQQRDAGLLWLAGGSSLANLLDAREGEVFPACKKSGISLHSDYMPIVVEPFSIEEIRREEQKVEEEG